MWGVAVAHRILAAVCEHEVRGSAFQLELRYPLAWGILVSQLRERTQVTAKVES